MQRRRRGSRQLARTGYQLLGTIDSFLRGEVLGVRPCTSVLCGAATTAVGFARLRCAASMSQRIEALSGRAGLQCASIAAKNRSTARLRASVHHQLSVAASCERHSAFTARRSEGLAANGLVRTTVSILRKFYSAAVTVLHGARFSPPQVLHTQQASAPAARPYFQRRRVPLRLRASRAGRFFEASSTAGRLREERAFHGSRREQNCETYAKHCS